MARTPWKKNLWAWDLAGRCSSEFYEMVTKLTLNIKLHPWLKFQNFFTFLFFNAKFKSERISVLDHVPI